jgi:Putative beta-barrel porin-2, OmpL-like. bbp2
MKKLLVIGAIILCNRSEAQDPSKASVTFSGYAEAYYTYDFNKPADNNRPGFIYSHNRHNEFNLNLGFVKAAYSADRVRANLALAAGTYMNANYAAEPGVLKNVYEANVGVKISKTKNLWIDAGIMPSHIGFESAASKDCWTLTRTLMADNSPYYEAGVKITYVTTDNKWLLSAMALNGWQRITRVDGNSLMSWGTQVQYKPSGKITLNYSTFIGSDKPDNARQLRVYHNLYGIFAITEKAGLTVGLDIGTEEKPNGISGNNTWFSPVLMLQQAICKNWSMTARAEYYKDKMGVIIPTSTSNGFQTMGYSLNLDYAPAENVVVRMEGRLLSSKDNIFPKANDVSNTNSFISGSIAVSF